MSVALYMDVHVAAAITRGLRIRGVDVLTSQEDGTRTLPDEALLDRATALGRVLFSRDEDLLGEAVRRQRTGQSFSGLIYAHQLNVPIGACIADLELIAKVSDSSEWVGPSAPLKPPSMNCLLEAWDLDFPVLEWHRRIAVRTA